MYELKHPMQAIQVTEALLSGVGWPEWCRDALLDGSINLRTGICAGYDMDLTHWVIVVGDEVGFWQDTDFRSLCQETPQVPLSGIAVGSVWEYLFGYPPGTYAVVVGISGNLLHYLKYPEMTVHSRTQGDFCLYMKPQAKETPCTN